jgi:hypothetical protein
MAVLSMLIAGPTVLPYSLHWRHRMLCGKHSRPNGHVSVYTAILASSSSSSSFWQIMPPGLFQFRINLKLWILQAVYRTPLMGDQAVARPLLYTGQQKHRTKADKHQCLEWYSNPWSQCFSDQRNFVSSTERPLWPTATLPRTVNWQLFNLTIHLCT